jgi:hypothetical protein
MSPIFDYTNSNTEDSQVHRIYEFCTISCRFVVCLEYRFQTPITNCFLWMLSYPKRNTGLMCLLNSLIKQPEITRFNQRYKDEDITNNCLWCVCCITQFMFWKPPVCCWLLVDTVTRSVLLFFCIDRTTCSYRRLSRVSNLSVPPTHLNLHPLTPRTL